MEEVPIINSTETTILAALSTLSPLQLSHLTHSISTLFHPHRRRLSTILSSPNLFFLTLHHLHTLSIHQKSLLIARHLSSVLSLLTRSLHHITTQIPTANLRHLDSALLLLLLCELRQHDPQSLETPLSKWRLILSSYVSNTILTISTISTSDNSILIQYVDIIGKCRRFVGEMCCRGGGKDGREVGTSVVAVVSLPSVEVTQVSGVVWKECVICKEEMKEGRDVCKLPCDHLFHWICILPWLKKRNTCPCCRYRLPTDDVYGEIKRLWEVVVKVACSSSNNLGV